MLTYLLVLLGILLCYTGARRLRRYRRHRILRRHMRRVLDGAREEARRDAVGIQRW